MNCFTKTNFEFDFIRQKNSQEEMFQDIRNAIFFFFLFRVRKEEAKLVFDQKKSSTIL